MERFDEIGSILQSNVVVFLLSISHFIDANSIDANSRTMYKMTKFTNIWEISHAISTVISLFFSAWNAYFYENRKLIVFKLQLPNIVCAE